MAAKGMEGLILVSMFCIREDATTGVLSADWRCTALLSSCVMDTTI